jgi:hypothetical protein
VQPDRDNVDIDAIAREQSMKPVARKNIVPNIPHFFQITP